MTEKNAPFCPHHLDGNAIHTHLTSWPLNDTVKAQADVSLGKQVFVGFSVFLKSKLAMVLQCPASHALLALQPMTKQQRLQPPQDMMLEPTYTHTYKSNHAYSRRLPQRRPTLPRPHTARPRTRTWVITIESYDMSLNNVNERREQWLFSVWGVH